VVAHDELSVAEAHWHAAVAVAPRLEEHDLAALMDQLLNGRERGRGGADARRGRRRRPPV
jgi:hypothetical protein